MKTRKLFSRGLAVALSVLMLLGAAPTPALAAANTEGLHLRKETTLADDGTYTIQMEAYADGELKVTEKDVPLDIVLVLDQSGSMGYSFTYNEETVTYAQFDGTYYDAYSSEVYHQCTDGTYKLLNVTREWVDSLFIHGYKYTFTCAGGKDGGIADNCPFGSHGNQCALAGFAQKPSSDRNWGHLVLKKVTSSTETTRVEALKTTLNNFVASVKEDANATGMKHKIAIVGFASESGNGNNTEILTVEGSNTNVTNSDTIGVAYKDLTTTEYKNALVNCDATIVKDAIKALAASGATRTDLGMEMAKKILDENVDPDRKQVVIMFTDGVPTSSNTFSTTVADDAIKDSYALKTKKVDVYTVGIFDDAAPATLIENITGNTETDNANRFMHATSSNYPKATKWGSYGAVDRVDRYLAASDADQLNKVFDAIAESVTGSTKVTLTEAAVMKDVISEDFRLPDGFNAADNVKIQVADWDGSSFGAPHDALETITASVDLKQKSVSVTGFSYKDKYCVSGQPGGQKLIVTITGVEAENSAAIGEPVESNISLRSGIYENSTAAYPAMEFDPPTVTIGNASYVLDYAKPVTVTPDGLNRVINLDGSGMHKFTSPNMSVDGLMQYGVLAVNGTSFTYTPGKMTWDGYDSVYAFGKDAKGENAWTKVSFIPANNVYYEDTFVTKGTITGIKYDGNWTTDGTPDGNTETPNPAVHGGWLNADLADDTKESDGTSARADVAGADARAVATFSFTGTGVDVYSRTNTTTGLVRAQLYTGDNTDDAAKLTKVLVVDNLAQSGGDYYQIPTVSFSGLDYGTYTVKLTVGKSSTAATGTERSEYFLDGIRVYNPLPDADTTVIKAYGDELGATFKEVRDILLDANTLSADTKNAAGIVFIDYNPANADNHTTADIGTYKDYGPKNEAYLAKNQAIAFSVVNVADPAAKISVGLKAPSGDATTAKVTKGSNTSEIDISHASDLYYEITPNSEGYVVIKNIGDSLLSVTKLKISENAAIEAAEMPAMMAYVEEFDTLPVVAYAITPEIPQLPVTPEVPETPAPGGETEEPAEDKKDDFQWIFEFYFEWLGKNGFLKSLWQR